MAFLHKNGFGHLITIIVVAIVALALYLSPIKRYVYMAYQNTGMALGANFNNIASQTYVDFIKSQTGQYEQTKQAIWMNQKIAYNDFLADAAVLGDQSPKNDNKWIEIDLSEQKLYMKEGESNIASFLVSTGKWAPTPTGDYRVWTKLRYTTMSGGNKALGTYYSLPNVPYTMYFYQGYGIHGAYWHNNFGNTMSHGCVNMKPEEAGIVFNWAQVGTRVVVRN
ncbi:MAG: L,D-transpeptidase [Candidatus Curtissbacteria bacterium]